VRITRMERRTASRKDELAFSSKLRWPQLSEQYFRVDKWSLCQG
jgi:hypothetical protein